MHGLPLPFLQGGHLCFGRRYLSGGAIDIQLSCGPLILLVHNQFQGLLLDSQIPLGNLILMLETAKFNIIACDFGCRGDQYIPPIFYHCPHVRLGGLDAAFESAEHIKFP